MGNTTYLCVVINTNIMKKYLALSLVVGFALTACGTHASNRQNTKKQEDMKTIQLTKADFLKRVADYETNPNEWKYLGDKPAIIDFYADWCGPCKMVAPILEELAAEYEGKIDIYKVNTEKEQELAAAFGIRSIPSLLFIPMQGAPQMARGAMPKTALKEAIDSVLLPATKSE
jgi:thioredoxin